MTRLLARILAARLVLQVTAAYWLPLVAVAFLLGYCACATGSPRPETEWCSALCRTAPATAETRHCGCRDLCAAGLCAPEIDAPGPPETPWRDAP